MWRAVSRPHVWLNLKSSFFYLVKCSLGERYFVIHTGGYLKLLYDTGWGTNVGRSKDHHPHINLGHNFKLPKDNALTVPHLTVRLYSGL